MKISAPGKLMISGEWSILENEVPCISAAVDKKVNVEIGQSKEIEFEGNGLNVNAKFLENKIELFGEDNPKEYFLFVAKACEATLNYLKEKNIEINNFKIQTDSKDTKVKLSNIKEVKVGFGSSAAVVVSAVAAILKFHNVGISSKEEKDIIYKLACVAHFLAQGKLGSSYDVASSVYGGLLVYQKPGMDVVLEKLNNKESIKKIIESEWPYFKAENIKIPNNFNLSVGFSGNSASTKDLVLKIREFKQKNKDEYWLIINSIKQITIELISALKENNEEKIIELIKKNRILLLELSEKSKNNLETSELKLLSDIADENGGAGKFSGAGGGDCGIGISFEKTIKEKIESKWEENKIFLINANISEKGVSLND